MGQAALRETQQTCHGAKKANPSPLFKPSLQPTPHCCQHTYLDNQGATLVTFAFCAGMSATARLDVHCNSSKETEPSSSDIAHGTQDDSSDDDRHSPESDDHAEQRVSNTPDTQVIREVNVLRREMVHNFRNLHDGLRDTNKRLDELRDDHGNILRQQKAELRQMKAQYINKGAAYINNPILPVGRDDGMSIPTELSDQYKYVHEFLRLKRRIKWPALAALLRFYGSESWPTWGLLSLSPGYESDVEEQLAVHESLEEAISWAPEIALQDLARYLGVDYDRIIANVEEYERLQQRRADNTKRTVADKPALPKRERSETSEQQGRIPQGHVTQVDTVRKPASIYAPSEELGWDTRATEDRTPESKQPRFRDAQRDARRDRQSTLSQTSVSSSDAQLPKRAKT